jgi:hypothetical protein
LYVAAPATTRNLTPVVFFCLACRAKQLPEQFQNAVGSSPDSLLRHPVQALLLRQTSAHVGRNLRRLKKRYADCVCGGGGSFRGIGRVCRAAGRSVCNLCILTRRFADCVARRTQGPFLGCGVQVQVLLLLQTSAHVGRNLRKLKKRSV